MCRFFTFKNLNRGMAVASITVPLILMAVAFQRKNQDFGLTFFSWAISSAIALTAGYYIRDEKPCRLPHLAENIQIEEAQLEGQQRQSISLRNL